MKTVDRVAGAAAAAAVVAGLVALSHAPLAQPRAREGLLRLAWRARAERVERCREQTPDELRALPQHMRQTVICDGAYATYVLEVRRNGTLLVAVPVHPGGLRRDRPLYVFQEIPVPVGEAAIAVTFKRATVAGDDSRMPDRRNLPSDDVTRRREALTEAVPPVLRFEGELTFTAGQVHLISYDPERKLLFDVRP